MAQGDGRTVIQLKVFSDLLLINVAFLLAYLIRFGELGTYVENQYLQFQLFFNLAWIVSAYFLSSYSIQQPQGNIRMLLALLRLLFLHLLLVVAFNGLIKTFYSRLFVAYTYALILILLPVIRLMINRLLKFYRKKGFNNKKVVILGQNNDVLELKELFLGQPEKGYNYLGFYNDQASGEDEYLGNLEQLIRDIRSGGLDELYCSNLSLKGADLHRLIEIAENNLVRVKLIPETEGFPYKKIKVEFYDHIPVLSLRPFPLEEWVNRVIKRAFDLVFSSLVALLLLSWLLPLLALWIKLDSKGPVFFLQPRSGKNNASFNCIKLRSMYVNTQANEVQASKGDHRITRAGRIMRKLNLDELPQFINVLKGEMSVVGPRPHMEKHTEEYSRIIDRYMLRHFIKPGITGLSQVLGYRGETQDSRKMKNRIKVDIFYMENWTFLLDIKVIVLTIWRTFKGQKEAA